MKGVVSMSYDAQNIFTAMIDESGTIWEAGAGRKRQAVGIDAQKEQDYQAQIAEMQGVIDNYYNKLVELGAITPPKTPEQIAQEQAAQQSLINEKLLEAISGLQSELNSMKNAVGSSSRAKPEYIEGEVKDYGNSRNGNEPCDDTIGEIGTVSGQITRSSQKRNATGAKATAGDIE